MVWADPAGHRRNRSGDLARLFERDIADDAMACRRWSPG
jgi:hypothetical protein